MLKFLRVEKEKANWVKCLTVQWFLCGTCERCNPLHVTIINSNYVLLNESALRCFNKVSHLVVWNFAILRFCTSYFVDVELFISASRHFPQYLKAALHCFSDSNSLFCRNCQCEVNNSFDVFAVAHSPFGAQHVFIQLFGVVIGRFLIFSAGWKKLWVYIWESRVDGAQIEKIRMKLDASLLTKHQGKDNRN